ncbi:hypothetical protein [Streptacidiphilus rugosus]|uniref:hypothetical protein n=1 Tax=Streptacidiphilus rugosus TaxID=405783 RepID=UPI00056329D2|nr:hypothetical protein [Streptacidiphilus rugosus]
MPTSTVTITGFAQLIARTWPHAYRDDTLPSINGVRVESDGRRLYAVASDRFTIAIARHDLDADSATEPWNAFLTASDLRAVKAITPPRHHAKLTTLTWNPGRHVLAVTVGEHTLTLPDRTEQDAKFPKWRPIARDALAATPAMTDDLAVSAHHLAKFTKDPAVRDHTPLTVWGDDPHKPIVIAQGTDFLGLLMPIRRNPDGDWFSGHQAIRAAWTDTLADATTAASLAA